jgi:hypothetical protein
MKDYEPLIIDLKKSDPIRSARGSLTLFLLALLMGIVSATTFLIFTLYKTPSPTPSSEIIHLKTEGPAGKVAAKQESPPLLPTETPKAESMQQASRSSESGSSDRKDSSTRTPEPKLSPKPVEEASAGSDKTIAATPIPKKDKGTGSRPGDKPSPAGEMKVSELKGNSEESSERTRSDRFSLWGEIKAAEQKGGLGDRTERGRFDRNRIPEPMGFGFITVRTIPENVSVYLNERLIGITPLIEFQVPAGRHELKLIYKDAPPISQLITVNPLDTVSVFQRFENMGTLIINSSSSGAEVSLDGTYRGQTPLTIEDLPTGTYRLTVRKDGFETVTRTIEVVDGKATEVFVTLKRLGVPYPDRRPFPRMGFPNSFPGERRPERPYR